MKVADEAETWTVSACVSIAEVTFKIMSGERTFGTR